MKKTLFLLAALVWSLSSNPARATNIAIDLGPPGLVRGQRVVAFDQLDNLQFRGQELSLNLTFDRNEFVRLFKSTNSTFLFVPMLDVYGAGTIDNPTGTAYLFDRAGNPISSAITFGGSVTTAPGGEAVRLSLAGFFPLLAEHTGQFPLDIYGAHLDITLPYAPGFDVTGGELGLFPNSSVYGHNRFQIGNIPDSGCTLVLMVIGLALLLSVEGAIRRQLAA